jgi:hypothetical protein
VLIPEFACDPNLVTGQTGGLDSLTGLVFVFCVVG